MAPWKGEAPMREAPSLQVVSGDFVQRQSWSRLSALWGLPYKIVHSHDHTETTQGSKAFSENKVKLLTGGS